jgi:hypothetical protein
LRDNHGRNGQETALFSHQRSPPWLFGRASSSLRCDPGKASSMTAMSPVL